MRLILLLISLFALMLLASCSSNPTGSISQSSSPAAVASKLTTPETAAGMPSNVHVMFGNDLAGSPFDPSTGHDRSFHGMDRIVPKTVVIPVGGSITFEVHPFHQVAIYAPGTTPEDIMSDIQSGTGTLEDLVTPFGTLEDFVINDPINRLAESPYVLGDEVEWSTPEGTFDTPGVYFMMCNTVPHFFESRMYGYIIVK